MSSDPIARHKNPPSAPVTPEQRKSNRRFGLVLGVIAVVIFVGFIVKSAVLGM